MESNGIILSRKLMNCQADLAILFPMARTFRAAAVSIKTGKYRRAEERV
jgi:hypothetical protein